MLGLRPRDLLGGLVRSSGGGPQRGRSVYTHRGMAREGREARAWLRGAQAGSGSDFEALFRRHWPAAYRAAYLVVRDHAAAEDIAQEAFIAALRNLDRFDRKRPFAPWLHRIVVNRAIDWTRRRLAARGTAGGAELEAAPLPEASPGGNPGGELEPRTLAAGLAALSPEHRAVIVLRYLLDYTPGEIAELLGLPRGTVNSRLRRGLDRLEARVREVPL